MSRAEIEEEALKIVGSRKEIVAESYKKFLRRLKKSLDKAIEWNHRRMLVISGGSSGKQALLASLAIEAYARRATRKRKKITFLYMYHDEFEEARLRKEVLRQYFKKASKARKTIERVIDVFERTDRYLGTTYDSLVLDLTMDFKPNDVGRLVEIVRGGGLIVLIAPSWSSWEKTMTLFKQKLLVPGYSEPRHVFLGWVKKILLDSEGLYIYDADKDAIIKTSRNKKPLIDRKNESIMNEKLDGARIFPEKVYSMTLTRDQLRAVQLQERLVERPRKGRKTVLVITADRGRGKSCALGIGLVGIADALKKHKHKVRILVTAPSPTNVQSLFTLASKTLDVLGYPHKIIKKSGNIIEIQAQWFSIEYWEPMVIPKLNGDIVAVDEASGIHVPLLLQIQKKHSRIVYTATLHGYEGAGRGFSVRFLGALKEDKKTDLYTMEMKEPIRYAPGDPIERWLYRTLLLDAEPAGLDEEDYKLISGGNLVYRRLEPEEMFTLERERTLREFFGIYVLAHYRNQPDDLALLADAPHHEMRAIFLKGKDKIVGSLQIAFEGGLENEIIESLLRGNKIPGNIVPDRILKHHRIRDIGYMKGIRVVRIASHPNAQDRGIGSRALEELYKEAVDRSLDWVGSGFGVNPKLLNFWIKNGFTPLHMSPDKNPVSGEYTILVVKPISKKAEALTQIVAGAFREKLVKSLKETYRDLEVETVKLILDSTPQRNPDNPPPRLDKIDADRLWIYSYGPMTYEALSDLVWDLVVYYFVSDRGRKIKFNETEEALMIMKVLQGRGWEEVSKKLRMRAWDTMLLLKKIVARMIATYYSKKEDSEIGVWLSELVGGEIGNDGSYR